MLLKQKIGRLNEIAEQFMQQPEQVESAFSVDATGSQKAINELNINCKTLARIFSRQEGGRAVPREDEGQSNADHPLRPEQENRQAGGREAALRAQGCSGDSLERSGGSADGGCGGAGGFGAAAETPRVNGWPDEGTVNATTPVVITRVDAF